MGCEFSVGMAVVDTPNGFPESVRAMFTIMSLSIHHPKVKEILLIDNNPHPKNPLQSLVGKVAGFHYVAFPSPKGTAAPRNHVFEVASRPYVACIDPHVLLYPSTFEAIDEWYDANPTSLDLLQGPLMTENREYILAHHMNDQWRAEMWGTWGTAWISPKGGLLFSVMDNNGKLGYLSMPTGNEEQRILFDDELEEQGVPTGLAVPGHERVFLEAGCSHPIEPFEIPGHGMGFFCCRKDAWLPFDSRCRGFGGEEMTTGIRYRMAGRRTWCITEAKWWHHFSRWQTNEAAPYLLSTWDKIRNYIIEFTRLGLDIEPIRRHFQGVSPREWQQLLEFKEWPTGHGQIKSREEALRRQLASGGNVSSSTFKIRQAREQRLRERIQADLRRRIAKV